MATPYVDLALVYDAARLRCDAVFDGVDLVLDDTPATPLLIAIGTDRRAHTDDVVPNVAPDPTRPLTLNARRGWVGDALDTTGALIGSRIWVYLTQKQTQPVRHGIEGAAAEALDFFESVRGQAVALAVSYPRRNMVSLKVDVAETSMSLDLGMLA
jgi:phage gp46-like protein